MVAGRKVAEGSASEIKAAQPGQLSLDASK